MAMKGPPHAALAVAVLALLAACTTTPIQSTSAVPQAGTAIDAAIHDGAAQNDPADLAMAQQKLAMAQKSAADGNYDDARRAAEEATIDAQLASARSRTLAASNALSQLQGSTPPERQ
jgi:type IV pilus biogenesis protein CpaD/CtpE